MQGRGRPDPAPLEVHTTDQVVVVPGFRIPAPQSAPPPLYSRYSLSAASSSSRRVWKSKKKNCCSLLVRHGDDLPCRLLYPFGLYSQLWRLLLPLLVLRMKRKTMIGTGSHAVGPSAGYCNNCWLRGAAEASSEKKRNLNPTRVLDDVKHMESFPSVV